MSEVKFYILNKMHKFLKLNSDSQIVTRDQINKIPKEGNTINFKAAFAYYRKFSVELWLRRLDKRCCTRNEGCES